MFKALPTLLTRGFASTRLVTIFHQVCKKATKFVPRRTRLGVGHLEISTSRKDWVHGKAPRYGLQDVAFYCCDTAAVERKVIHTQPRVRLRHPNIEMKSPRAL